MRFHFSNVTIKDEAVLGTQLLLERIEGRTPGQNRVVVLPAQFVVRKS